MIKTCRSTTVRCSYCEEPHYVDHRNSQKYKEERAIVTMQTKERMTRREAIQHLEKINPDQIGNYSKAVTRWFRREPREVSERTRSLPRTGNTRNISWTTNTIDISSARNTSGLSRAVDTTEISRKDKVWQ